MRPSLQEKSQEFYVKDRRSSFACYVFIGVVWDFFMTCSVNITRIRNSGFNNNEVPVKTF
jgi:hypothetical protein